MFAVITIGLPLLTNDQFDEVLPVASHSYPLVMSVYQSPA